MIKICDGKIDLLLSSVLYIKKDRINYKIHLASGEYIVVEEEDYKRVIEALK